MVDDPTDAQGFFPVDPQKPGVTAVQGVKNLPPMTSSVSIQACWSKGPLKICATYSNLGIDFEIKLLGQDIGSGRLDQKNATVSIGVNLGIAKAGVSLTADFSKHELVAEGEVCRLKLSGDWDCAGFREVILRW